MKKDDYIYLGSLVKTHGANGKVLLITKHQFEEYEKLESVFFEINKRLVPFFVSTIRQKSNDSFLIVFDNINNETKAQEFLGCNVFLKKTHAIINSSKHGCLEQDRDDILDKLSDLIGFSIIDENSGLIGEIINYHDIPSNPILICKKDNKEILIPFQKAFILSIIEKNKTVNGNFPEGLLDL